MKTYNFPYIALSLGLLLMLAVMKGSEMRGEGETALPVLTLLMISEFAFFVTAVGAYIGIRHSLSTGIKPVYTMITALCILLSVRFLFLGIDLWPL